MANLDDLNEKGKPMLKVKDVLEHFLSRCDWIDREKTVDRVIVGDPEKEVDRCLVTWMPSFEAVRQMVERGIHFMICHEPTFWHHRDDRPDQDPEANEKQAFIQENDVVIVRNHDCWDKWPDIGIPWSWAEFLELEGTPAEIGANGFQHRYDIEPVSLDEFASRVARSCSSIGEPMVQVTGDRNSQVSRIGIGTGCGCDIKTYIDMGCDCSIVCDDGSCYWANIQRAEDIGHPVIRVNHGTSEEAGMVTMTQYINENIEGLTAEHLPHGSTFRLVGAQ